MHVHCLSDRFRTEYQAFGTKHESVVAGGSTDRSRILMRFCHCHTPIRWCSSKDCRTSTRNKSDLYGTWGFHFYQGAPVYELAGVLPGLEKMLTPGLSGHLTSVLGLRRRRAAVILGRAPLHHLHTPPLFRRRSLKIGQLDGFVEEAITGRKTLTPISRRRTPSGTGMPRSPNPGSYGLASPCLLSASATSSVGFFHCSQSLRIPYDHCMYQLVTRLFANGLWHVPASHICRLMQCAVVLYFLLYGNIQGNTMDPVISVRAVPFI